MRTGIGGLVFALAALCLCASKPAAAGSFSVSPVRATLSADKSAESLVVRNNGTEAAVIQLEVAAWSQQDSQDVFSPTREVLATPPIFTVPPGGTQVVRIGMRRVPDARRQLTYRLFLQEVPGAPKPGFQGLQVALRLSVPIFVSPTGAPAAHALAWQASLDPGGQLRVAVSNSGNAHVQVDSLQLETAAGKVTERQQVSTYVLPGNARHWVLKPLRGVAPGAILRLAATTDSGDVQVDIAVAER